MGAKGLVMVVDDDPVTRRLLSSWLEEDGYEALILASGQECLDSLQRNPRAICLDVMMEPIDGMQVLREIRRQGRQVPVIMITARDSAEDAVEAMKAGAHDYIVKPIDKLRFRTIIQKALEISALTEQLDRLRSELAKHSATGNLIGKSPPLKEVIWHIRRVADANVNVLIQGESGTGKELVARAIHELSPYQNGPFIDINCGAIPENLQESEFFGHEKGAFTGAIQSRPGKLELADGGTVFLDEVSEMTQATQVKLLRFLQERSFERVGGSRKIKVNLRVIAATNRVLEEAVSAGTFREDLYYRLLVYPILVPPLRARREDIPLLVAHFLSKFEKDTGKAIKRVSPEAMDALMNYAWPGNVRELENVILRMMISTDGDSIDLPVLPPFVSGAERQAATTAPAALGVPAARLAAAPEPEVQTLAEIEKRCLVQALKEAKGNVAKAAKKLGIGRTTCYRKVKAYSLQSLLGRAEANQLGPRLA
jgi:DNA-binding NtrC family response regulator